MTTTGTTPATATGTAAAAAAASTTGSAASSAADQLGVDYNNFLQLLTAQIQNQDPLQPMDSTQFVSQLAQLSQVEQSVQTNQNLETLNTTVGGIAGQSSIGLLGRSVSLASDRLELSGGVAATTYELASAAASVSATITDDSGNVVRSLTGLSTAGGSKVALGWDGKNNSGVTQADGIYHVTINAVDASGDTISYDTYPTTTVEQVLFGTDGQTLKLRNGQEVTSGDILSAG
ncbi:flagellar hook assembly protein FlgD [Acidimangrovimonas sediminis]|uniref:flagellar hook assembly protein FlgD n=1 Tax=Acidimangrovimonas sediminis TaxID=2056283 RepID=UPI001304F9E2|nr:flagellar hook capping FlgD N-terminal domain-containing protein [Acidimangrovimonas sediminis]